MTVAELIIELQKLNQDLEVVYYDSDIGRIVVLEVQDDGDNEATLRGEYR